MLETPLWQTIEVLSGLLLVHWLLLFPLLLLLLLRLFMYTARLFDRSLFEFRRLLLKTAACAFSALFDTALLSLP